MLPIATNLADVPSAAVLFVHELDGETRQLPPGQSVSIETFSDPVAPDGNASSVERGTVQLVSPAVRKPPAEASHEERIRFLRRRAWQILS